MTAKWGYNPQTPDGAGEAGKATSRRRVPNPPQVHEAWWWIAYAALVLLFVVWRLA